MPRNGGNAIVLDLVLGLGRRQLGQKSTKTNVKDESSSLKSVVGMGSIDDRTAPRCSKSELRARNQKNLLTSPGFSYGG
jgi:hypothetical protein